MSAPQSYIAAIGERRVFPDSGALADLACFEEQLPEHGFSSADVRKDLRQLSRLMIHTILVLSLAPVFRQQPNG